MLWIRYGLLCLWPFTSLKTIYAHYLESTGTKVYSVEEHREAREGKRRAECAPRVGVGPSVWSECGA